MDAQAVDRLGFFLEAPLLADAAGEQRDEPGHYAECEDRGNGGESDFDHLGVRPVTPALGANSAVPGPLRGETPAPCLPKPQAVRALG